MTIHYSEQIPCLAQGRFTTAVLAVLDVTEKQHILDRPLAANDGEASEVSRSARDWVRHGVAKQAAVMPGYGEL